MMQKVTHFLTKKSHKKMMRKKHKKSEKKTPKTTPFFDIKISQKNTKKCQKSHFFDPKSKDFAKK